MRDYTQDYRRYVVAGVALLIVVVYIIRLFTLQITSDDYKKSADSNAFLKKIEYPSRGGIYDRNGKRRKDRPDRGKCQAGYRSYTPWEGNHMQNSRPTALC